MATAALVFIRFAIAADVGPRTDISDRNGRSETSRAKRMSTPVTTRVRPDAASCGIRWATSAAAHGCQGKQERHSRSQHAPGSPWIAADVHLVGQHSQHKGDDQQAHRSQAVPQRRGCQHEERPRLTCELQDEAGAIDQPDLERVTRQLENVGVRDELTVVPVAEEGLANHKEGKYRHGANNLPHRGGIAIAPPIQESHKAKEDACENDGVVARQEGQAGR